jgi:hypothetical protein
MRTLGRHAIRGCKAVLLQFSIQAFGVLEGRESAVPPESAHLVFVGNLWVEDGHPDGLHKWAATEEQDMAGLVGQAA